MNDDVLVCLTTAPASYGLSANRTNDPDRPLAITLTNRADGLRTTAYLTPDQIRWLNEVTHVEPASPPTVPMARIDASDSA